MANRLIIYNKRYNVNVTCNQYETNCSLVNLITSLSECLTLWPLPRQTLNPYIRQKKDTQ